MWPGGLGRGQGRLDQVVGAAFGDGPGEQPPGAARRKLREHAQAPGGLAEHRHIPGVAAEPADVALHPAQRGLLVHQPVVAGRAARPGQGLVGQEAERAEPVVERDDDDAVPDQPGGVVVVAFPDQELAAVHPHHDGQPLARPDAGGREHVQVQAVLRGARHTEGRGRLRAVRAERGGLADAMPVRGRVWGPPAQRPDRWGGVGDTEEFIHRPRGLALHGPVSGADDERAGTGRMADRRAGPRGGRWGQ